MEGTGAASQRHACLTVCPDVCCSNRPHPLPPCACKAGISQKPNKVFQPEAGASVSTLQECCSVHQHRQHVQAFSCQQLWGLPQPLWFAGLGQGAKAHTACSRISMCKRAAASSLICQLPGDSGLQGLAKVQKREQQVWRQRELQHALGRQADLLAQHKRLVEKHLQHGPGAHPEVGTQSPATMLVRDSSAATAAIQRRGGTSEVPLPRHAAGADTREDTTTAP